MELLALLLVIVLALGLDRIRGASWNPVVGPKIAWPWAAPGLGVVAFFLGLLTFAIAQGPNSENPDEGCLDICFVPSEDAINAILRDVTLLLAGIAATVGVLALRKDRGQWVGISGLCLAAVAAGLVAASI